MAEYNIKFGEIRLDALGLWCRGTGRTLKALDDSLPILIDDFIDGFECSWQTMAWDIKGKNWHVPHFCSLGDWASNITDILTDSRYDNITFGIDEEFDQCLFRYYTRFMLIISEVLTGFADLLDVIFHIEQPEARKKISTSEMKTRDLFSFINSVCKHKTSSDNLMKLHKCNNHLPILFEDSGQICHFVDPLKIGKNRVKSPDGPGGIVMPKLEALVSVVLKSYKVLDEEFLKNPEKFEKFVSEQGDDSLP